MSFHTNLCGIQHIEIQVEQTLCSIESRVLEHVDVVHCWWVILKGDVYNPDVALWSKALEAASFGCRCLQCM